MCMGRRGRSANYVSSRSISMARSHRPAAHPTSSAAARLCRLTRRRWPNSRMTCCACMASRHRVTHPRLPSTTTVQNTASFRPVFLRPIFLRPTFLRSSFSPFPRPSSPTFSSLCIPSLFPDRLPPPFALNLRGGVSRSALLDYGSAQRPATVRDDADPTSPILRACKRRGRLVTSRGLHHSRPRAIVSAGFRTRLERERRSARVLKRLLKSMTSYLC